MLKPELIFPTQGNAVFFFFFFMGPRFGEFCKAAYETRRLKPTLTISGLLGSIAVVSLNRPITFEEYAARTSQPYNTAAIQIAQLAEGRSALPGLGLLSRLPGKDRRQKLIVGSQTGRAIGCLFDQIGQDFGNPYSFLNNTIYPIFRTIERETPSLSLGAFCVFLSCLENEQNFQLLGQPSSIISTQLGVSNLPRHLKFLSEGSLGRPGVGLVELTQYPANRRILHPKLTAKGLALVKMIDRSLIG